MHSKCQNKEQGGNIKKAQERNHGWKIAAAADQIVKMETSEVYEAQKKEDESAAETSSFIAIA